MRNDYELDLEDTVRSVVNSFMDSETLFTALDVSNEVKKEMPTARHKDVRNEVRRLFADVIEPAGWARSEIDVKLENGDVVQALLYHPLSASWSLDERYDDQRRSQVSSKPAVGTVNVDLGAGFDHDLAINTATLPPDPTSGNPLHSTHSKLWDQYKNKKYGTTPSESGLLVNAGDVFADLASDKDYTVAATFDRGNIVQTTVFPPTTAAAPTTTPTDVPPVPSTDVSDSFAEDCRELGASLKTLADVLVDVAKTKAGNILASFLSRK